MLTYLSRGCVVICCHLLVPSTSLHTHPPPPHLVSNTLINIPPTHSLFTHHNFYPFLHMPSAHFPYHYTFTSTFTIILSTTYINQAQNDRYCSENGGSSQHSTDSEISFGSTWLDAAILGPHRDPQRGDEGDDAKSDHSTTDGDSDMAGASNDRQERRLQLLESAVMGMTEEFDSLMLSLSNNPNFCSTQPRDKSGRCGKRRVCMV